MVRVLAVILAAFLAAAALTGCKEKPQKNRVDLKQFDADNSTDYRFIFRETIREQEEKANKLKKYDFR
ncbi:MAG TPA: hypothetical protein PLA65_00775 [Spirochaetota bacterium]|nr:hypothetical protein [Spirochaetota bacterium]HOD15088.1 hypothetical protein [Spirochaetota bacterium]HPG50328.1 hypothetical protein [Spirochaetota bacterium]HPN10565.1 hypothetical protein [Spirochaetota bacterium]